MKAAPLDSIKRSILGMTLIELLVAMSILMILCVLGYKAFGSLLIAREHLMQVSRQWLDVSRAFRRMGADVSGQAAQRSPFGYMLGHKDIVLRPQGKGQILTLSTYSSRYPSGSEQIVYNASQPGLIWSVGALDNPSGAMYTLLGKEAKVSWRLLLQDNQWVTDWPPPVQRNQNVPIALEMHVALPGGEGGRRVWALL